MVKTISPSGKGLVFIIDSPLLDQLGIDQNTRLELTTDGEALILRPIEQDVQARFVESAGRMMDIHHETFRKLAE